MRDRHPITRCGTPEVGGPEHPDDTTIRLDVEGVSHRTWTLCEANGSRMSGARCLHRALLTPPAYSILAAHLTSIARGRPLHAMVGPTATADGRWGEALAWSSSRDTILDAGPRAARGPKPGFQPGEASPGRAGGTALVSCPEPERSGRRRAGIWEMSACNAPVAAARGGRSPSDSQRMGRRRSP